MDVRLIPVADAAVELGKDPSGIRRRLRPDAQTPLLTDRDRKSVILADGVLVEDLEHLVQIVRTAVRGQAIAEAALRTAEDKVELLKLELGELKARSTSELQSLAEALEAAGSATAASARALRERVSRD